MSHRHTKPGLAAVNALTPRLEQPKIRVGMRARLRRQLAPHKLLLAIWSAGWTARLAAHLTGNATGTALAVAGVAAFSAVFVALIVGRRLSWRTRVWMCMCLASAVTWLGIATGAGISWDTTALLYSVGFGLAIPWWRAYRIPNSSEAASPLGVTPETTAAGTALQWNTNIGCKDGPLPGSYLYERDPNANPRVERYTVQLRPGKQSIATALSAIMNIASGLSVAPEDVVLERHLSGDASKVRLTVVRNSPIRKLMHYPGPQWEYERASGKGTVNLGVYADGEGQAPWRVFTRNSMWGGIIIGGTGSGKSRLLEGLVCSARSSGLVTVFYGDPQHGTSSDALASTANWPARGNAQIMSMLRAVDELIEYRGIENSAHGRSGFTPSTSRPGFLVVIDECHMLFQDPVYGAEALTIVEKGVRIGRKLGLAFILASQEGDLPTFGGNNALRSNLQAGNQVILRTQNKQTKNVLGLEFDPTTLPQLPGYGYTVAPVGSGGRTAPFRSWYLDELTDEELDDVHAGAAPRRGTSHWWLTRYPDADPAVDEVAIAALGEPYRRRNATVEAARAALRETLEDLLAGRRPNRNSAAGAPTVSPSPLGPLVAFPQAVTMPTPQQPTAEPRSVRASNGAMPPSHRDVLQAIRSGITKKGDIIDATGLSETAVRGALYQLIAAGEITRPTHGVYVLKESGCGPVDQGVVLHGDHFHDAVRLVVTTGLGSAAMLQRRMGLELAQAEVLMEQMHSLGIVGPIEDDGLRDVLMSAEALDGVYETLASTANEDGR